MMNPYYMIRWKIDAIKERIVNVYERIRYGYSRSDIWGLSKCIAEFILPRLAEYRRTHMGYPNNISSKQWDKHLDAMILAFQLVLCNETTSETLTNYEYKKIDKGLALFAKYYQYLWD